MQNTLTSPPVAPLLDRLYRDAAQSQQLLGPLFGHFTPEERAARMADPDADYLSFYAQAKDVHMPVSRSTGTLLYMLARGNGSRSIVEFGTSYGISTVQLAAALRDNGGGQLIGSEFEPGKLERARANLAAAKLADLVEIRAGDALQTLARDLPNPIDLVLLDGHKGLYAKILELLAPKLRSGSYVIADNADACPAYQALVRAPQSGYLSMPFDEDVELTLKL
jgi:predicted O-methyltransferase YrrM